MQRRPQRVLAASAAALTALTMGACASSERDSGGGSAEEGGGGTFVFGAAGDPAMFDPAFATDGESFRVTRQIYDGLLTTKAGSADIVPALAEDYEVSEDGLEYTFTLREGVKFTDGTDFNAEAVCYNFDRWYNFEGLAASPAASEYYQNVFGGFASTPDVPSLYESCEASDESTAVIKITQVTSRFPAALTLPSFAMQSPDALEKYDANNLSGNEDALSYPAYALEHPTGTGPFKLESWDVGNGEVTIVRNEDYWGEPAKVEKIIFRTISDGNTRRQELEAGEIDGYDLVAPADYDALEERRLPGPAARPVQHPLPGHQRREPARHRRQPGAEGPAGPPGDRARDRPGDDRQLAAARRCRAGDAVRAAVGRRLGRRRHHLRVRPRQGQGAARGGRCVGTTLRFFYPTDVSRPYLPDPAAMFEVINKNLTDAGFVTAADVAAVEPGLPRRGERGRGGPPPTRVDR